MGRQIYSLVQLPLCDTPKEVLENAFRGTRVKALLANGIFASSGRICPRAKGICPAAGTEANRTSCGP